MTEPYKLNMNRNLRLQYKQAISDEDAAYKDSEELSDLSDISDRYVDEEFIAAGGMKKIYSCFDAFTSRKIAKAVPIDNSDSDNVDRFIREAKITASLQHPNIVPVYELALDGIKPYFTMKLLKGRNLSKALRRGEIKDEQILEIFLKICNAIAYAHSVKISHLDLKPENIHFDGYGDVLVCDWGLAKNFDDRTESSTISGTPGFMAPEQYLGKPNNNQTDVYSLGVLLYYLYMQGIPHDVDSHEAVKEKAFSEDLVFSEEAVKRIPKSLRAVIAKAMKVEQKDRYSTVNNLVDDVRAYINGFATQAEDAGSITILFLFLKRFKVIVSLVLFFVVVIISLSTVYIQDINRERKVAVSAQEESMVIRKETSPELVRLGKSEYRRGLYSKAEFYADQALRLDPDNQRAMIFKMQCLFGRHDFEAANLISKDLIPDEKTSKFLSHLDAFSKLARSGVLIEQPELPKLIDKLRQTPHAAGIRRHFLYFCADKKYQKESRMIFAQRYLSSITTRNFNWDLSEKSGLIELDLSNNAGMYNVVPLRNLPIVKLNLANSPVNDISALKGMPLEELNLSYTNISDLAPIKDSPIKVLNIDGTNIHNIEYFKKMKVETLILSKRLFDHNSFTELKKLKRLEVYSTSFTAEGLDFLKENFEVVLKD